MNFSLSNSIYRQDQQKTIGLKVIFALAPLIVGAVYLSWQTLSLGGEPVEFEPIHTFIDYLYREQKILLIFSVSLVFCIPLIFISARARASAFITIGSEGFEYNLPFLERDIKNGLASTRKIISWNDVTDIHLNQGGRSQIKGIKGPPSSRLGSARIEIATHDARLIFNPFLWLQNDHSDHRLTVEQGPALSESSVNQILEKCPLVVAFGAHQNIRVVNTP
ncbi:MAG: hypothetical protein KUG80_08080 [Gammaproteobacteria bacterium]|nr:hypothetical protein [Gammaproteobacteria bacterium]